MVADAVEDDEHVGKTYDLGGPDVMTFEDVTRMLYEAEGRSVKILPVPMLLAKIALYAVDPISVIPPGIEALPLEMSNVTEHNDIDAFGLDESKLTSLSAYLRGKPRRFRRAPEE